jgi:lysine-N-methylase
MNNEIGKKIIDNISEDSQSFVLTDEEKCPFLMKNGLCEIISECGKEYLCDICSLHPRFKNFYTSFVETGLGLCCEEACRIILSEKDKFKIEIDDEIFLSDEEEKFINIRQDIFNILQNRNKSVYERFSELANKFNLDFSFDTKQLYDTYVSLERLDKNWSKELENINNTDFNKKIFQREDLQLIFEHLSVYFIFRHLSGAMWDDDYTSWVSFMLVSVYVIGMLFSYHIEKGYFTFEKAIDIVRMYSSEIEYSDENINKIIEFIN